jgi:hypothetical protein
MTHIELVGEERQEKGPRGKGLAHHGAVGDRVDVAHGSLCRLASSRAQKGARSTFDDRMRGSGGAEAVVDFFFAPQTDADG